MNILKKLKRYITNRYYEKHKRKHCPVCKGLDWKYYYTPYFYHGKKVAIEARVCNVCGYKDKEGFIIPDTLQMDKNLTFKMKKQ